MCPQSDRSDVEIVVNALVTTLEQSPVRYAVLYGSYAHRVATNESDIDIAVAFAEKLSAEERFDSRNELVVDLMEAVGRDNLDLADLDTIRPGVGLQALETGHPLMGDQEVHEEYRQHPRRKHSLPVVSRPAVSGTLAHHYVSTDDRGGPAEGTHATNRSGEHSAIGASTAT